MTQDQILEGNVSIAKFMGAIVTQPYSQNEEQDGYLFYYPDRTSPDMFRNHSSASIKYHCSWDWLMPVIEKISKTQTQYLNDTFHPRTFGYVDQSDGNFLFRFNTMNLFSHKELIVAAYSAVCHFIKTNCENEY